MVYVLLLQIIITRSMQGMCGGERSERALCMNFVLCTAHAEEKKRGVTQTPDVRTIIIIIIYEKSQMYHPCGARFARPMM